MDERIENYFSKELSDAEKAQFEADLRSDSQLRENVAFFLASRSAAGQEVRSQKLAEHHAEWKNLRKTDVKYVSLRTWYAVAAVLSAFVFGLMWYMMMPGKSDMKQLADGYVMENFTTLSLQMGSTQDSVQLAISNYNDGQYATSARICEDILKRDSENAEAKKIAGIVSLKMLDYDKAISYFHQLGEQKNLYANPGKFYEAIALLKTDLPLNKKKAESLLKEVVDSNLEGKEEAEKWLE